MKFHMIMLMNEWMMLVLMQCKCQMQCLILGCYSSFPLYRNLAPRFERPTIFCKKWDRPHVDSPLIPTWHLVRYGYSTPLCRT